MALELESWRLPDGVFRDPPCTRFMGVYGPYSGLAKNRQVSFNKGITVRILFGMFSLFLGSRLR